MVVCFAEQDKQLFKRTLSRSINDSEILLLSALNGLKTTTKNVNGSSPEDIRRQIRSTLKFGGVASTMSEYDERKRVQNDQASTDTVRIACFVASF